MPFEDYALYGKKYNFRPTQDPQNMFFMTANPYIVDLGSAPPGAGTFGVSSLIALTFDQGPTWSTNEIIVTFQLNGGGEVGLFGGQTELHFTQQSSSQYITFAFTFPTTLPPAPFQSTIALWENWSGNVAGITITGQITGAPTGIGDYITVEGPDVFSAITGSLNPNCPPGFCTVQFSAQFIDFEGNNTQMNSWNWKLELKRQQQGFQTVRTHTGAGGIPYSDFILQSPLSVFGGLDWERNSNGEVAGKVTASGYDNEGYYHTASMNVAVSDIAPTAPVITLPGRKGGAAVS